MLSTKLDHCVIHVSEWQRSNTFYTEVLGAELVTRPAGGFAYRFGDKQLNWPMQRNGAKGPGTSIYFRDPDGSLMEFMSYR